MNVQRVKRSIGVEFRRGVEISSWFLMLEDDIGNSMLATMMIFSIYFSLLLSTDFFLKRALL